VTWPVTFRVPGTLWIEGPLLELKEDTVRIARLAGFGLALLLSGMPALAAEKTWTGSISDSMCNGKHAAKGEHGVKVSDADCTKACIDKGAKYVFVSGGKTYQIANQDFAGLKDHAGHRVALTGEMKGNDITVSKIEMPAAKKPATK
jgi:hypothetical protein